MSIFEPLQSLYRQNIEEDVREPILSLPMGEYGTFGLLAPHPMFWVQFCTVLTIQSTINAATAVAIYLLIVKNRGSAFSYLIGYGVICPSLIVIPFQIMRFVGMHNMSMLVGQAASMSIVLFRCLMAIHGTLPSSVEQDLQHFVMFYVAPIQFNFDSKTGEAVALSKEDFRRGVWKTFKSMAVLAFCLGLMVHHRFELVQRKEIKTFLDLFYWRNLLNNYAMAYLTGTCLDAGSRMVGTLVEFISWKSVIELSDNPMTASSSPSDFWGRRWNSLVHIVLKGGIYIPLRKNGVSKGIAAFVTFAASGMLHEYVLTALAFKGVMLEDHAAYIPKYGIHLAFFAWNGLVLVLEGLFYKHPAMQWIKKSLPQPVIVMMVIMTVLPVGHWFTDEYAEIGFYDDYAVGMPVVVWAPFETLHVY